MSENLFDTILDTDGTPEQKIELLHMCAADYWQRLMRVSIQRAALLAACEAALTDTLKPQHLQEPDHVIPMLKAAITAAKEPS